MDVNGLAGGLELYFGEDVLRRADGTLTPVHWRGFDAAVGRYQGEVIDKAHLQDKFTQKLRNGALDHSLLQSQDWSPMRKLLDSIRSAFEYPL